MTISFSPPHGFSAERRLLQFGPELLQPQDPLDTPDSQEGSKKASSEQQETKEQEGRKIDAQEQLSPAMQQETMEKSFQAALTQHEERVRSITTDVARAQKEAQEANKNADLFANAAKDATLIGMLGPDTETETYARTESQQTVASAERPAATLAAPENAQAQAKQKQAAAPERAPETGRGTESGQRAAA